MDTFFDDLAALYARAIAERGIGDRSGATRGLREYIHRYFPREGAQAVRAIEGAAKDATLEKKSGEQPNMAGMKVWQRGAVQEQPRQMRQWVKSPSLTQAAAADTDPGTELDESQSRAVGSVQDELDAIRDGGEPYVAANYDKESLLAFCKSIGLPVKGTMSFTTLTDKVLDCAGYENDAE